MKLKLGITSLSEYFLKESIEFHLEQIAAHRESRAEGNGRKPI